MRLTAYEAWTNYSDVRRVLKFGHIQIYKMSVLCLCKLLRGGITQSAEACKDSEISTSLLF